MPPAGCLDVPSSPPCDARSHLYSDHARSNGVGFASDSLLERGGFELPVPDQKVAASGERQRGQALLNVPYAAGTGSSNLLCSSGESRANLSSSEFRRDGRPRHGLRGRLAQAKGSSRPVAALHDCASRWSGWLRSGRSHRASAHAKWRVRRQPRRHVGLADEHNLRSVTVSERARGLPAMVMATSPNTSSGRLRFARRGAEG